MRVETGESNTTYTFNKKELQFLVAHAPKDDSRVNLFALCFDPEHDWVYTTDGHRAAIVSLPEVYERPQSLPSRPVGMPRPIVQDFIKLASARDTIEFTVTRDLITARLKRKTGVSYERRHAHTEDSDRPPIWQLRNGMELATVDNGGEGYMGVNPVYLRDLHLLAAVTKSAATLRLGKTPLDPCLVSARGCEGETYEVIIMPVKVG